jgi:recombination associated protein RdgC
MTNRVPLAIILRFWEAHAHMWFKNLALLRFTEPFALSATELEERLEQRRFRHCGSLDPASAGWCAPLGKDTFPLVHATNGFLMICLQKEEKILPASVVNEIVTERAAEIEEQRGAPVRRKEKDSIRDEVLQDLLPRAFSFSRRIYAYIDPKSGWLVVDSTSAKKTDELTGLLRQCLGSLPVVPFATRERPSAIMTQWLAENAPPPDVTLESECELRSPEEDGGIVRCRRHDLSAPEIQNHLEAGKEVIKLAVTWNDRLSLVLDEALAVKRLRFLDLVQEDAAEVDTDDPVERFDADFAVMSLELAAFLPRLADMFGGENLQAK